jgi:hypothetical protein
MKKSALFLSLVSIVGILLFQSCKKDSDTPPLPVTAAIFKNVQDSVVSFAGLTQNATEWFWDFGDGQTSTEQAPVHTYTQGGYYIATLKALNSYGDTATAKVQLTIRPLPPYACLTGDYMQENYKGKTWKLTRLHSAAGDYIANADAALSVVDGTPSPLPDGMFDTSFGMGDIYKDTYTFFYDGSYQHDVKDDGAAFGGIVYQNVLNGGADIINSNGKDYGLCIAKYTPQANATFTYAEKENLTISSVYGANGTVTYKNVSTLNFSGNEFVGFRDYQQKVIIRKITDTSMQLVMFMAASPDYFPANTNALVLSFEVVQ